MKKIQSKKHNLGPYEIEKVSLSCFDDKRYVLNYGICTLTYFYNDSCTSCKQIKKIVIKKEEIKKDCDKKEEIKKDCEKTSCQ